MQQRLNLPKQLSGSAPRVQASASSFLARQSVTRKLGLAALTFTLPVAALTFIGLRSNLADLTFTAREQAGTVTMQDFLRAQDQLGAFTLASQSAGAEGATKPADAAKAADQALDNLVRSAQRAGLSESAAAFTTVRENWTALLNETQGSDPSVLASAFAQLVNEQLLPALTTLLDDSNLLLDPESNSSFTMQGTLQLLPEVYGRLLTLQLLTGAYRDTQPGAYQRSLLEPQIREQAVRASAALDSAMNSMERAAASDPRLQATQGEAVAALTRVRDLLSNAATTDSIEKYVRRTDQAQFQQATELVARTAAQGAGDMRRLVGARLNGTRSSLLLELLGASLLTLAAFALLYAVARAIAGPLGKLSEAAEQMGRGNLGVQVPVTTQDEIGLLAGTFNGAVAQLRENEEKNRRDREEAARLQDNIGEFLNVTMDIADGDLTKRGRVTEDVLGNVVDSINVMTEELALILKDVQRAAGSVNAGSQTMLDTTGQIGQVTTLTAEEAQQASARALEITAQIQQMAQQALASADTARQALIASQQGQEAVQTTLQGMTVIRDASQSVSERVAALSARSEEIREIAEAITHIASQTNLLALHASIEAAGAGEAGGRFRVVAQEVRELADTSSASSERIAGIVQGIQQELQNVSLSLREHAQAVERGYQDASLAGQRLSEIGTLAEQSASFARDISAASQQQVQGVKQMGQAVQDIATVATESQQSVQRGRQAAEQLRALAQQLDQNLSRFRLPG